MMKMAQILTLVLLLTSARGFAADPIVFSTELTGLGGQASQVFVASPGAILRDDEFSIILGSSSGPFHTTIIDGGMIMVFDFGISSVNNTIETGTTWGASVRDAPLTSVQTDDLLAGNWTVNVEQNGQAFSGQLVVVPEPSTVAIAGACLAGLLGAHRHRRRATHAHGPAR